MNELQKDNNPKTPPAASPEKPAAPAAPAAAPATPAQPAASTAPTATPAQPATPAATPAKPAANTAAAPAKPAATPTTAPSAQNSPAAKSPVQFHSAMTTKASQPKDYFAEQNKKREENKKKRKKQLKLGLIIGIPLGVLAIAAIVMLIIWNMNKPVVTPSDVNQQTATDVYDKAMNQFNKKRPTLADSGSSSNSCADPNSDPDSCSCSEDYVVDTEAIAVAQAEAAAEADKIFEDAITEATANRNTGEADALRVAQMLFYVNTGTDYSKMIEIGEKVENPSALELQQQLQYYNILAIAYAQEGNSEKTEEYFAEARRVAEILNNGQETEGGV